MTVHEDCRLRLQTPYDEQVGTEGYIRTLAEDDRLTAEGDRTFLELSPGRRNCVFPNPT